MKNREEIRTTIPSIIHDGSAAGCLVQAQEILTELKERGLLDSVDMEPETYLETMLEQVLRDNPDLREISARNGVSYYYSVRSMSENYARMLVWKLESPLCLIAEVVRESAVVYPSPVRVVGFGEPPFDLTQETILECLDALGRDEEYQDIKQTITSAGTTFLYSSRYLDPDYAAMLAEWIDVGQACNP